jgi:Coenzyme PQQ synthesis protein D (PqqD)
VGFDLSPEAARLWSELDGSALDAIVRRFAARFGVDPTAVETQVHEGIRSMADEGAVEWRASILKAGSGPSLGRDPAPRS